METASWTRLVKTDFVHVWTCHDFAFTDQVKVESPCFTDNVGFLWHLSLDLNCKGQSLELRLRDKLGEYYYTDHTSAVHFLDKHGKIFEPEGWKSMGDEDDWESWPARQSTRLPFDLREHLGLLLHNGNLRIQVRLVRPPQQECGLGTKIHYKDNNAPSTLISDFNLMFQNLTFSDVTICSGAEKFPAHKVILAGRSPVFRAMLEAPMKEAATNTVIIDEFSPEVVKGMLQYLYSDDVTAVTPTLAAEFLQIADYYILDKLKCEAESIFSKNLTVENAAQVLTHSITYRLDSLKSQAIEFIISNNIFLTECSHLIAFARTNKKEFLELVKDERMATKASQLIDIMFLE